MDLIVNLSLSMTVFRGRFDCLGAARLDRVASFLTKLGILKLRSANLSAAVVQGVLLE